MQMSSIKITQGELLNERQLLSLAPAGREGSGAGAEGERHRQRSLCHRKLCSTKLNL